MIAHLSDKRLRGSRDFSCGHVVVGSGSAKPIDEQEYQDAHESDRVSRRIARKRGHSQPLSSFLVKRSKAGISMAMALKQCIDADDEVPSNIFDWYSLPPCKEIEAKVFV